MVDSAQPRVLVGSVAVLACLVLVYAFVIRPWHMRWGATDAELALPLPIDPHITADHVVSTRAVTVHASAAEIWPWLVQLGQERAGFYSYEWLENLFAADMRNGDRIVPEWQNPQVGRRISYMRDGPGATISLIEPEHMLMLDTGWMFVLSPVDERTTRLIVRYSFPVGRGAANALFYYVVFEPAHFVMESGMMTGIKHRAELTAGRQALHRRDVLAAVNDGWAQ
jgi:hypothetical protein